MLGLAVVMGLAVFCGWGPDAARYFQFKRRSDSASVIRCNNCSSVQRLCYSMAEWNVVGRRVVVCVVFVVYVV